MIQVNNKKAVKNLADKSFRANKTRNGIAIAAIVLTSILFCSLFTMGMGTMESIQMASLRQIGGGGHGVVKYIDDSIFNKIKTHRLIKEIGYSRILSDEVKNEELLKRRAEFWYYDDVTLRLGFCEPAKGHKPTKENEVMADSKTLEMLGVPLVEGSQVKLELEIHGKTVTREFVLCGWWESDPVYNVGQIFASKAYMENHEEELTSTYQDNGCLTGTVFANIIFDNSTDICGKMKEVIEDCGYSIDEADKNYLSYNENPAFISSNFKLDFNTLLGLGCGALLIILTGYLIIYNIFQISVIQDIKFYGLLKTIGTTKRQIRRMIRRQACMLTWIGIPFGLFFGYLLGKCLVPLLMSNTSYKGSGVSVTPNIWVFIGSAAFSIITVLISTLKPGRTAAAISPIEAVRYTDNNLVKKRSKQSVKGAKMPHMALSNLGRNKKRTILVVLSLSLSLVLMNTVFTISDSLSMDKFMGKFHDTDFLIAHADYFNNGFYGTKESELSEAFIETVKGLNGYQEGGRLYNNFGFTVSDKNYTNDYNVDKKGDPYAAVYGMEQLPLDRLVLLDGKLDVDKLKTGKYILAGVQLDDNEKPLWKGLRYRTGDTVTVHYTNGEQKEVTKTFTVLGVAAVKYYTNTNRFYNDYTFYLPADTYKTIVEKPVVMSYVFNAVDKNETEIEKYLKEYTDNVEPKMNYDSKAKVIEQFHDMMNTIIMIGGTLCIVIGIIGILNFINSMLTSIVTRKKEFAMLNSIGMTRKQLVHMLCYEGLYYAGFTAITSVLLGFIFSKVLVKAICNQIWFLNYHFILMPILICMPILFVMGILIPLLEYGLTDRQSIVERLREIE